MPSTTIIAFLTLLVTLCPDPAQAQQAAKIARVGFIAAARNAEPYFAGLKDGLRELGLVHGQNLIIDYRFSEDRKQLSAMAAELIDGRADVIVTQGPAALVLKAMTAKVPVVFGFSGDPVEAGLVYGMARPGRNMTGMSFMAQDLSGKRLELLRETIPKASRVAIVSTTTHPGEKNELHETENAARALKATLKYLPFTDASEVQKILEQILKERAEAILTFPSSGTMAQRTRLSEFAVKHKLPSMFGWREYAEAGGLMSYGPNLNDSFRRLAVIVDKILKGAMPADIPVEQPTKFELVINLKTAKQIGLAIPPSVLARADRIIR